MHSSKFRKKYSNHVEKPGDHLRLSSLGNKNCGKYLEGMNTMMPEKLKYTQNKDKDAKMKSVKPGRTESAKDDAPTLIGEIQLDTGKLQIGYDKKDKKMVFSFVQDDLLSDQKEMVESCAFQQYAYEREIFKSRDINFYQRAVSGRCDVNKSRFMLERQFDVISDKKGNNTMIDRVLPFHQLKQEKNQMEQLKELQSHNMDDRSNIHTAMSTVKTAEYKKAQRKLDFSQKFIQAMDDAKQASKFDKTDDYFIYLNRKRLVAEALDELERLLNEEDESEDDSNKESDTKDVSRGGEVSEAQQSESELSSDNGENTPADHSEE